MNNKNTCIIGAGFIGCSFGHYLLSKGIDVSIYDNSIDKQEKFKNKVSFFEETGFDWTFFFNNIRFHTSLAELKNKDLVFICIGANVLNDGYDSSGVKQILSDLYSLKSNFDIVIRTTLDPKSLEEIKDMTPETNNLWFYPEYLREGNALNDIPTNDNHLCRITGKSDTLKSFMNSADLEFSFHDFKTTSYHKILSNAWRATKISFMNASIYNAKKLGVDIYDFNKLFISDNKNTSDSYLKLGGPFGGYCLPKETDMLVKSSDKKFSNIWNSTLEINNNLVNELTNFFLDLEDENEYVFKNIAFKSGTDDLRNSPYHKVARTVISSRPDKYFWEESSGRKTINGIHDDSVQASFCMEHWFEFL